MKLLKKQRPITYQKIYFYNNILQTIIFKKVP